MNGAARRRIAYGLLWLALAVEAAWLVLRHVQKHVPWLDLWYPLFLAMPFALLAATYGRQRWIAASMRLPLAVAFLQSLLDRFGVFGKYGDPGVSFGDFAHFAGATRLLNPFPFLPNAAIVPLAVLVTILESSVAFGLLFGFRTRIAALGAAGLLFLFATAMTAVLGFAAQASFGVYVLAAGAWALALSSDPTRWSIDALLSGSRDSAPALTTLG